ncbi:FtsK/SpoIIIE domain-containing protein [Saccharopolyspora cebuensis]|uniref:FtsK/SpoIIIE domain-containing protein n=1 Tax=Saccharopolyspora cebuensis TaxID=418759 RepID=A0ABV4CLQ3_9PSEU
MTISEDVSNMGDLIRFPHRATQRPEVDGTSLPAPGPVEQEHDTTTAGTPGAELAMDTERAPAPLVRRAKQAKAHLAEHGWDYTKTGSRFVARHGFYLLAGTWDTVAGAYKRWTGRDIDERIAAAQAAGEHGVAAQLMSARTENRKLLLDRIRVFGQFLKYTPHAVAGTAALVLGATLIASVVAFFRPEGLSAADVWNGLFTAVEAGLDWTVWAATVGVPALLVAVSAGVVITSYNRRRLQRDVPGYLAPMGEPTGKDVIPDEGAILQALRNLGLPALNKRIKEGWVPRWVEPTTRDGRGWRTQLELPQQVTVEDITDKKTTLAHNLVRKPGEVWPTEPRNKPGVLDLWVADQGVLSGPIDPWPLLEEGTTDFFQGVPVGIDQRGDEILAKLMACNYIIGGTMGSGKSSLVINLLLGAMLDPLVEIDVHVMAYNTDYDALKPRLRKLIKGDEDEDVDTAITALRELRAEVTRRGKKLEDLGGEETKLTREIAAKDPSMRPRLVVFDECQELFEHETYGKEAKELAAKVQKKARKCGIVLVWVTPSPSAASLPRDLAKTASHRVCFAIGDHQGSDAVLGTGKHKQGITATGLVPGEDVGTAMASGFRRDAGLLRCHHVRKDKDTDQHTPVVERALGLRKDTTPAVDQPARVERDLLDDIAATLGDAPAVKARDVVARLRELAPDHRDYRTLTAEGLVERLDAEHDYTVRRKDGYLTVRSDRIQQARAERGGSDDTD